jgi:ammonia channel protein AmtB
MTILLHCYWLSSIQVAAAVAAAAAVYCLSLLWLLLQLCAGHIRVKNNMNILLKNLLDCAVGTMAWFLIG